MKITLPVKNIDQLRSVFKRLSAMELPTNGWSITVEDFRNNRSLAQNRLLWGNIYTPIAEQISEATGSLVKRDTIHEFMTDQFGVREEIEFMGKQLHIVKSTTKYTKSQMTEYIEKIYAWAAQNGVWLQ